MKLINRLNKLPKKPGVYLFKDSSGEVLYVGKAKNLRNRIRSYFQNKESADPKTKILVSKIKDLDYIIVSTETESLILENTLIKKYKPRYNVRMRDDKNYQFIKIDYEEEIPQIYTVRKTEQKKNTKNKYFGPYTSGLSVKKTLKLIKRIFQICRNKKVGSKPCFAYHLGRCPGVCVGEISINQYKKNLEQVEQFLKYHQKEIVKDLQTQMKKASGKKRYEYAALLRDRIRALENIWEKQKIISPNNKTDEDYIGLYKTKSKAFIILFLLRDGRLMDKKQFSLNHQDASDQDLLEKFLLQYYQDTSNYPKNIYVPNKMKNSAELESALTKLTSSKIKIRAPQKGKKKKLINLSTQNAKDFYERDQISFEKDQNKLLSKVQNQLGLAELPNRIEGFDISNIQGTNPVGSMVVFTNGLPDKNQYRKFKIKNKETPDDTGMMKEMINRRIKHFEKKRWPIPDLMVIDGGKGQLNAALSEISKSQKQIPAIGLAKKLEEIYLPGEKAPLKLPEDSPVLQLLQRLRDEAHRFALGYHTKRRSKSGITSQLDEISGIGPKTKRILLKEYGSIAKIRSTSEAELAKVIGPAKAKKIKQSL